MPLYINKLAPWEEKRDYLQEQVFRNDMSHNIGNIGKALKKQLALGIQHSKDILISQERISEGIDNLAESLGSIKDGVNAIGAILEWVFSEIVWQLEQNREYLKQIVEVLMAPLDTQARERKKRAEKALANGWYQDAEEEFLVSEELNKFDFTIHVSLGMIALFHNIDKHKAAACRVFLTKYDTLGLLFLLASKTTFQPFCQHVYLLRVRTRLQSLPAADCDLNAAAASI